MSEYLLTTADHTHESGYHDIVSPIIRKYFDTFKQFSSSDDLSKLDKLLSSWPLIVIISHNHFSIMH